MNTEKQMSEQTTEETLRASAPMKVEPQAPAPSEEDDGLDIPAFLRRI